MKKFEVPFNFDPAFVEKFSYREDLIPYIDCFYAPAWKDDCENTRFNVTLTDDYPKSYEEYVERLEKLKTLGVPINILMQKGASVGLMEKYMKLGIDCFTINDDALAGEMKEKHPEIKLTLSVTRVIKFSDLLEHDFSMYDRIVLWHWFGRHIDAVAGLPDKYSYVLICNSGCNTECIWHEKHWYLRADNLADYRKGEFDICLKCREGIMKNLDKSSLIEPEDLQYFDPYVDAYKLIDRIDMTEVIIDNLNAYAARFRGCPKGRDYYNT